ncbi:MAG TPA: mechanosensitive ion channel family protein [Gemmatimonadaceae bacterium]|nr:mechanosensitive ion channel family protein [Gemmatimonadaceae bacterium]
MNAIRSVMMAGALLVAAAAGAAAQRDTAGVVPVDSAGVPVVYGGDTLFRVYAHLGPFSATERAAAIPGQLRRVSRQLTGGDSVVVLDQGAYSELAVDTMIIMTVLDGDARPTGVARPQLARQYAAAIQRTVVDSQAKLGLRALLMDVAFALIATGGLVLLLWLIRLVFPRLYRRIETLRQLRFRAIKIQNLELLSAGRLSGLLVGVTRVLRVLLTVLLFYIYIPLVLSFFPWTQPLSQRIVGYAIRPFAAAGLALVTYLPNLFYLAAGVIIVRYALRLLRTLASAVETGTITLRGFFPEWADPTYKIVRVLVFAFAATVLYPYLPGASSNAFKGVSIFLGVLFSLGSSGAVGNMVAGVVLTYTRAFQVGDLVKIGETVGEVLERTLLVTRVRTIKNVAVTIPNGAVLADQVVNYTTLSDSHGLILHTSITIGYDAPWQKVHELLIEAAKRTEHLLPEPAPFVFQTSLDDFYVAYEINATTDRPDLMAHTLSELHRHIQDTFNEGGVEILSPHYRGLRDGNAAAVPPDHLPPGYRTPAFQVETSARTPTPGGAPAPQT